MLEAHLLRRALRHQTSALLAPLGPQINDPVGVANNIHVVLDDDDAVPQVGQPMQDLQQLADIIEVQPRRRLIQNVKHPARLRRLGILIGRAHLRQVCRQLHALRLAA